MSVPKVSSAVGVALSLAAGLAARVWVLFRPMGALDSDGAVVGLMGMHVLRGETPAFYWGQAYGGSHEAYVAAAGFALFGVSATVLKVVPLLLNAASAILVWRIGRRLAGDTSGRLIGVLFWLWPPFFVLWSVRMGTYWGALVSALIAVLLTLQLAEATRWRPLHVAAFGVALGNAFWASPQAAYLVIPGLILLAPKALKRIRSLLIAFPSAFLGALPWLAFNLRNDFVSLTIAPQPSLGYAGHLVLFLKRMLPMALGLRQPFGGEWLFGLGGKAAYALFFAFVIWLAVLRPPGSGLPLIAFFVYPILYAASPYSWYSDAPRYQLFLAPWLCMLLILGAKSISQAMKSGGLARQPDRSDKLLRVAVAGLVLTAMAHSGLLLADVDDENVQPLAPDVQLPVSFSGLESLLEESHVRFAYADYWVAYRATFEAEEDLIVEPLYTVRYMPYSRRLAGAGANAYIFLQGSLTYPAFRELAEAMQIHVRELKRGPWLLALPEGEIPPQDVFFATQQALGR